MILVTGATGQLGGETARMLIEQGERPRVLVRNKAACADPRWAGVQAVVADFDRPDSLDIALQGVTSALLVSPSTPSMVSQQSAFVAAAARASRRGPPLRITKVSGFLTAVDSPSQSGRWHAEIEANIEAAGLPATFLRMPFFMQNLIKSEHASIQSGVLRTPLPTARIAMIDARDIAAVAARCLLDDAHIGQRYYLTGPAAVSIADVAQCLSTASGRQIKLIPDSLEEARAKWAAAGTPRWRIEVVTEFNRGFEAAAGEKVTDTVLNVTGEPPRSLERFVREHLIDFGG